MGRTESNFANHRRRVGLFPSLGRDIQTGLGMLGGTRFRDRLFPLPDGPERRGARDVSPVQVSAWRSLRSTRIRHEGGKWFALVNSFVVDFGFLNLETRFARLQCWMSWTNCTIFFWVRSDERSSSSDQPMVTVRVPPRLEVGLCRSGRSRRRLW